MPILDLISTLYALSFGGVETGIIPKPIYEKYGRIGLIGYTGFLCLILFGLVWYFRKKKVELTQEQPSKKEWVFFVLAMNILIFVEAVYSTIIIQNFLVPQSLSSSVIFTLKFCVTVVYFVSVFLFTQAEMKGLLKR